MQSHIGPDRIWPVAEFFRAKMDEQRARHTRFDETAYKLEPNVKESPGGLRDIQTIAWVAKRHFGADTLYGLVEHGFLSEREYAELRHGQAFLWRVRFALHTLASRNEDRLLFDYQVKVAQRFGYRDARHNLAVEQFMQKYYRNIKALSAINDILLQLFSEAILHSENNAEPVPINPRFQSRHGFIEVRDPEVFRRHPSALLEIFYLMQTRPRLTGIRAETLRLMRRDRRLIDNEFRADMRNRRLFTEILCQRGGVTRALRRMNRYGILGRYLAEFGRIIGRMQYDLFHTLTVDEHTLFVIRNLRRLRLPRFDHELPFASEIMQRLDKPHLLYVAGLFHDIAKGRGGDHSELGALDAETFCREHGISSEDTELVCWLVRQHLLMSMTAQRKDISDPAVVHEFAQAVGGRERLDRLFLFTICDIRATNPELWNSWKESLLTELYHGTTRALARGLENPLREGELIAETRSTAAATLTRDRVRTPVFKSIWARMGDDYFLRHTPTEIAWHTTAIARRGRDAGDTPLVMVDIGGNRGTTVFVYTRNRDYLFGLTTGILAQLGLSILDARINTTRDGYTVDSYVVTESDGDTIAEPHRAREIEAALAQAIADPEISRVRVTRRASRRSRAFTVPTQIYFRDDPDRDRTVMELITADRPGLLSTVGDVFRKRGILVDAAKIATIGERAEDIFYITDRDHRPIADPALFHQLRQVLTRALDRMQKN
jgi:[protein-PII] uridylyltransferase